LDNERAYRIKKYGHQINTEEISDIVEVEFKPTTSNLINSQLKENIMLMPFNTETEITVSNENGKNLIKDKTYQFNMSVKVEDEFQREELLSSFRYLISSPNVEVIGMPDVKLTFNNHLANSSFQGIPREKGSAVIFINLLQNFKLIDRLQIDLTVS
jgi:hypothetical protein